MQFITDFADQAVMLPLAVVIAGGLAANRWWRGCAAWVIGVTGMIGAMAVLKYLGFACAAPLAWTTVHSPSGHTAASATIYGGAALLMLRGRVPAWLPAAMLALIVVVFGLSRLAVHAHDVAEVIVGGAVGVTCAILIARLAGPRPAIRLRPMLLVATVLVVVFHGVRLQAESAIHHSMLLTWIPLPASCHR